MHSSLSSTSDSFSKLLSFVISVHKISFKNNGLASNFSPLFPIYNKNIYIYIYNKNIFLIKIMF